MWSPLSQPLTRYPQALESWAIPKPYQSAILLVGSIKPKIIRVKPCGTDKEEELKQSSGSRPQGELANA